MDILSINANQRLITIASSIGRDPQSWRGWHCLLIKNQTDDKEIIQDCLVWAKAVVQSYLKGTEGRIYACRNGDIHIICRNAGKNLLEQVGMHIQDYINAENQITVSFVIYDLAEDGFAYASNVLARNGNILSPSPSVYTGVNAPEPEMISELEDIRDTLKKRGFAKVLLVEDDPVTRWMVRHALKDECQLATAPTANRAFALYPSWKPDVVFLDINLPDNNGLAVLEWIKRNDPGACVVMFSSASNMDSIADALETGASGFVAKPFLKESLVHYIHKNIG
jgi:two-component system, chemotaxis family, chemotaxis protein CheY